MQQLETRLYGNRRLNGVAFTAVGVASGVVTGLVLRRLLGRSLATVVATAACAAGKMLDDEARRIGGLLGGDSLDEARQQLRSLVGRTTDDLDEHEISRAVIESVAENAVDAVTSSIFWASIGGAPLVLAHRALNTLDAMVGHHNDRYEHFGWASARLDDVANYVPARLTAVAVAAVRPPSARTVWSVVRRDAGQHPSPNGGVVEAAFAAALGVRLGGTNRYGDRVEHRGTLGDGAPPTAASINEAARLRRHATAAVGVLCVLAPLAARATGLGARGARNRR